MASTISRSTSNVSAHANAYANAYANANASHVSAHASHVVKFTPADFERIKNNGFDCPLSPETIAIIQSLSDHVGAAEYIKAPQFIKQERKDVTQQPSNNRKNRKVFELNNEAWEAVRNFKATLIVKKEGMGAVIDQIRKHLNKMTTKTYDTLKDCIIKEIAGITEGVLDNTADISTLEDEDFINQVNKIGEALFTIASGNSFYSTMYAKLYKELMAQFAFMKTIFETNFQQFNTLFNDFTYCDPNKDYDQFCLNNKVNEKRRALSLFYVNLMKEKLIDAKAIETILTQIRTNMERMMTEPDKKNIVDEMTEIFYIIIVNGHEQLQDLDEYESIEEFVNKVAGYKANSFPSITNKTIFKFMDITDVF
jgi:hypothetical protein